MAMTKNESKAVRDVHEIRIKLHEETKNMTPEEEVAFYNNALLEIEKRRGRKFRRPNDTPTYKAI